jgi:hypothetical protein
VDGAAVDDSHLKVAMPLSQAALSSAEPRRPVLGTRPELRSFSAEERRPVLPAAVGGSSLPG